MLGRWYVNMFKIGFKGNIVNSGSIYSAVNTVAQALTSKWVALKG